MDQKPKTGDAKKKAPPDKAKKDQEQFERFIEAARTLNADESGKSFEEAVGKIIKRGGGKAPS